MSTFPTGSRVTRNLVVAAIGLAVLVAMALDTKFLSPSEAKALNPAPFSAKAYASKTFPKQAAAIAAKAIDLTVLAPVADKDVAAAGQQYGNDLGSGSFAFPVKAAGTVKSVDADFVLLDVPGMPAKDAVRIPLAAALSGNPVRDATGTIKYADFADQTDYQAAATEFKLIMASRVVGKIDPPTLKGRHLTVVGAWATGGPPNSYIIQPVSIEAGS